MKKENIKIQLDEKVIHFIVKDTKKEEKEIENLIHEIVFQVCEEEQLHCNKIFVSIVAATKEEIKSLNQEYRHMDKFTDVLSFPIFDQMELKKISSDQEEKKIKEIELGDIVLCLDVIKDQALEYQTGILRETLYMITHGICHLVGYDHMVEEEKIQMRELEEKILTKIGIEKGN